MTKFAFIIIHNKTNTENISQITSLSNILLNVTEGPFTNPDTGETWTTMHQELQGLNIPHEIKVYQVIPFGVTLPANRYEINSGGIVYYGKGDEDKIGNHPRFFNWGLKRGTDYGADVSVYLSDPIQLTAAKLRNAIGKLVNDTELVEVVWGKLVTVRLLKEIGQLKEDRDFSSAITDLKQRVVEKGLKIG